jgi:hypothetical protein
VMGKLGLVYNDMPHRQHSSSTCSTVGLYNVAGHRL